MAVVKQQLHQAVEEGIQKEQEKQLQTENFQKIQQAKVQIEAHYQSAAQQINDLKTDNTRLHQMAHQIQANLEHYQQSMQALRTEQALETEKREATFQREIQQLKQELSVAQQMAATQQEGNKQKNYLLAEIKETVVELQKKIDNSSREYGQANQEIARLSERCHHLEQSLQSQQEKTNNYQSQAKDLEKKTALLTEQGQQLTSALRHAEDKVEALRHEKLFLVQEKAELKGSLKQLQKNQTFA